MHSIMFRWLFHAVNCFEAKLEMEAWKYTYTFLLLLKIYLGTGPVSLLPAKYLWKKKGSY